MQFERRDFPTIMDGLVVRYLATGNADYSISASRNRVSVHYPIGWATADEGAEFMSVLAQAENHMIALRKSGEAMPFYSEPPCVVRYVKPGFAGNPDVVLFERATS